MTVADYQPFVERMIFRYEGGYGWDKSDPGGPTKYGITCYDLAEFMHEKMDRMARWAPIVKAMTLATADQIYQQKYAVQCDFNDLMAGADCTVFDFGVNSGSSRAIKYAQDIVGVAVDGIMGPITLAAINAYDPTQFINSLCNNRLSFLKSLSTWSRFGKGWRARVADLRSYSLALLQPAPLVAEAAVPRYQAKSHRFPRAFAKAYGDDELQNLGAARSQRRLARRSTAHRKAMKRPARRC
jgi:lysozyme family protein